jgi:hypothetical protein
MRDRPLDDFHALVAALGFIRVVGCHFGIESFEPFLPPRQQLSVVLHSDACLDT